jgi:hypothetical protein
MALTAAGLGAAGVGVGPASATIGPAGIAAGKNITVFHNIDFVATFGWTVGDLITVEVERNGVLIGTETGPAVETPEGGALEVNHGPEVLPPADGDCFEGHTPDIRPGDLVRVRGAGTVNEVIVDNITFSGDAIEAPGGDILVKGVAKRADGTNIPVSFLDSAEFRDTSAFRGAPNSVEVDPAVDGGFIMRYLPPYNLVDGRNTDNLTEAQRKASLLTTGGHAIGFGHVAVLPAEAMLVDGLADTPGPALGCEASVAAVDAVTTLSDDVLNQADVAAGGNLTISGASFDATGVAITVGNLPAVAAVVSGAVGGPQTWTASVPISAVAGLADGTVTVSMAAIRSGETTAIGGVAKTLVKDTTAPAAPTASPNGGSFTGSTNVTLSGAAGDAIRYTVGDGSQAAPTPSTGSAYVGAIPLSQSATIKAIAIDAAGNVSALLTRAFARTVPPAPAPGSSVVKPLAPGIGAATAGARGGALTAVARWSAPRANGAVVKGYEVRALKIRPGRAAKIRPAVAVGASTRRLRLTLPAGSYRFQVRAVGAAGASPWSERSAKVTAR